MSNFRAKRTPQTRIDYNRPPRSAGWILSPLACLWDIASL
jgi:hypothetical protein